MPHLALDLGTTNSQIATLDGADAPRILDIDGAPAVPSIAYVEPEGGNVWVGARAEDCWSDPLFDVSHSFRRWKLRMGESEPIRTVAIGGGRAQIPVTPAWLTTHLVRHLIGAATADLGGATADSVIATVPHGWRRNHPERCAATRDAVREGAAAFGIRAAEATLSEPVAAAAYWIWEAAQRADAERLRGRHVLVCDMGGGTTDLSLVRVSEDLASIDVVDAVHHDVAGDYADALICRAMAERSGAVEMLPATAEEILPLLDDPSKAWLRRWFREAGNLKVALSRAAERRRVGSRVARHSALVEMPDGKSYRPSFDLDELQALLGPFYEQGRALVGAFLDGLPQDLLIAAVTFAGGGSRIFGVRDEIVARELARRLGAPAAELALSSLAINSQQIDKAVAKGAALIANGAIRIVERLLYNVGVVVHFDDDTASTLGLAGSGETLVTQLLARGATLPTRFDSESSATPFNLTSRATIDLQVVLDDGSNRRSVMSWSIQNPLQGRRNTRLRWELSVDSNGMLALELTPEGASPPLRVEAPLGEARPFTGLDRRGNPIATLPAAALRGAGKPAPGSPTRP